MSIRVGMGGSMGRNGRIGKVNALVAASGALAVLSAGLFIPGSAVAAEADTTFTIVQVPDTQNEVLSDNALMASRYQWVADHQKSDDIRFVAHTGDVVNWGVVEPEQFVRADAATKVLDATGIPYSYAIGNHDGAAVGAGGAAAPGDVRENLRNTTLFNQTFPLSRFRNVEGAFEADKVDNMYQTFSAGGVEWLVLTLEIWPRTAALDWAIDVVEAHPNHNVIISTHVNVNYNGQRQTTGIYGDNNAQVIWDRLGSQYANVRMILNGHYESKDGLSAYYDKITGVHGNPVLQVMTAYTSPFQNHLRALTIDTKAMTISSAVEVPLSINKNYPSGKITDAASDFVVTGMDFVPPAAAAAAAPGAPTEVKATAGDGSAAVTFAAPADNGSPITAYTVTSTPGNIAVTGTGSPLTVKGLSNGTSYTFTVTATNAIGVGAASVPSAAVTPVAVTQLLSDPGFEKGKGGWDPFTIGELTRVTSPVRSGSYAMQIQSTSASNSLVGMTQNAAAPKSVAGQTYTAQCYVRPSTDKLEVRIRLVQYTQNFSSNTKLETTVVDKLPANTWTPVTVTAKATKSGLRIIPQIYASFQTTATGYLVYDDCSLTTTAP